MTRSLRFLLTLASLLPFSALTVFAGGPLNVGSPYLGDDGKIITWPTMPIVYHLDGGPMSKTAYSEVINHTAAVTRVGNMFAVWEKVPTTSIKFTNGGAIKAVADGDVSTVNEYDLAETACMNGSETPVILDADGSILQAMGVDDAVIGFSGICKINDSGQAVSGILLMNGKWQDGLTNPYPDLRASLFDEAISHEIGHLSGLDHSQINVERLWSSLRCTASDDLVGGMPLMFPYAMCEGRQAAGFPVLSEDDKAWISNLYPNQSYTTTYGFIRGTIYFSDGFTQAQGVNVIARKVGSEKSFAVSVVSGFLFTGNPGQGLLAKYLKCTPPDHPACVNGYYADNTGGSRFGSRSTALIGYYEISVPPGDYTVEVESVMNGFTAGSSVGPLDPPFQNPGVNEFWSAPESATDNVGDKTPVHVNAGIATEGVDIILNNTKPRSDPFDGARLLWPDDPVVRSAEMEGGRA